MTARELFEKELGAVMQNIQDMPSAHEGNRMDYLEKNDTGRYYKDNDEVKEAYFGNGET